MKSLFEELGGTNCQVGDYLIPDIELAEKKATPAIRFMKHQELTKRIAELTEELEKLKSEKALLLQRLEYEDDTATSEIRRDMER